MKSSAALVILTQESREESELGWLSKLLEFKGGPPSPGALGISAKPGSASLTHAFPIQFTLAQKDNSWVCSHPGPQHQSSFPGMW